MNKVIILTLTYVFGLLSFFLHLDIPFAIALFIFLAIGILTKHLKHGFAIFLALLFIFGNFNAVRVTKTGDELSKIGFKNNVTLSGRIITIPELSRNSTRLRFYFETEKGKTYVSIHAKKFNHDTLQVGNKIEIKGNLRKPFSATNPSQFDYAQFLARKNVFTTFYSNGENYTLLSNPTGKDGWWFALKKLDSLRDKIIDKHSKYVKSPNLEVLGGIVFGDDAINPPDHIKQTFVSSGLLHLLAASGLNVALIFGIWWFIAARIGIPYKINILSGMALVVLYTFMTGFGPSILRASIMLLFVLFGKLIDKDTDTPSMVFIAGLIILIFSPQMLYDVGFQLSFAVTIALVFMTPIIFKMVKSHDFKYKKNLSKIPKPIKIFLNYFSPASLVAIISIPIIAQLAVSPIQAYYFNTFTPYSVFANLTIVPFIGIISFLGFTGSIFGALGLDLVVKLFDGILNPFINLLLLISNYFAKLPHALLNVPSPNLIQIVLYYSLLGAIFTKRKRIMAVMAIVFVLSFIHIPSKNFEIMAFDVGNADCFLITTPKQKHIMIDTGKLPYRGNSQAKTIMNEYLKDKSIRTIDLLILTHPDLDHTGGTKDILKNFKVKQIIDNKTVKNNIVVFSEPNLEIKTYFKKGGNDNDSSVLTLVDYKGSKSLFMGDAGSLVYSKLKNELPKNIDILKVGHHGAKEAVDKTMARNLNPKIALISVGFNTYGHPNEKTIEELSNSEIITTQEFGALKFIYDEEKHNFKTTHFSKNKFIPIVP